MNFIESVLTLAGLVKNKTFKQTRFTVAPSTDFAVWMDQSEADGADLMDLITRHSSTIEVYMYKPDETVLDRILQVLWNAGVKYTTSAKTWIGDDQFYLVYVYFDWVG